MIWELGQAATSNVDAGDALVRIVNTISNTAQVIVLAYIGAKFAKSSSNGGIPVQTKTERARPKNERVGDTISADSAVTESIDESKNQGS